MAKKKKKAKRTSPGKKVRRSNSKFHGVVEHRPPRSGEGIRDGDHVVVAIQELSFGNLPETGSPSELMFDLQLATTDDQGRRVEATHNSGVFHYLRDGSTLNVRDWVVFDGPVRRHLSLQCEIVELEGVHRKEQDLAALAKGLVDSVAELPVAQRSPFGLATGNLPRLLGAALALNADDQVLKYFTSLRTAELARDGAPALLAGTHVFVKRARPRGEKASPALVTLRLRVQRVEGT